MAIAIFDRIKTRLTIASLALTAAACLPLLSSSDGNAAAMQAVRTSAKATLIDTSGKKIGTIALKQAGQDLVLKFKAKSIASGWHGVHLHTIGSCTAPDFKDAGGHWNPFGQHHGQPGAETAHRGDLPMILANAQNRVETKLTLKGVTLSGEHGLIDTDGAAIVIHAGQDDYQSDPAGNSGARIACGFIH